MEPCTTNPTLVQLVIAILAAINTGLATVLLNKRLNADQREKQNGSHGRQQSGSVTQKDIDRGSSSGGPRN